MDITKLRDEFASLENEYKSVLAAGEKDAASFTPEVKTKNDERFARLEQIKELIAQDRRLAAVAFAESDSPQVIKPQDAPGRAEIEVIERKPFAARVDMKDPQTRHEFGRAMANWARCGQLDQRFATVTTATQSNLFLPTSISSQFVAPTVANSFRAGYAAYGFGPSNSTWVQTPTTEITKYPVLDGQEGGTLSETVSSDTENVATLSQSITSTPANYTSNSTWFSNLDLSAVSFDLMSQWLPMKFYEKELKLEDTIASAIVADAGITQSVTAATTATVNYSNFVSLNNKLPKRYQLFKVMFLSADAFQAAEGLTASTSGVPMMVQDTQNQNLKRFNGTPVIRCDYFNSFGSSKTIGAIVSLVGFHLRDAGAEYVERYQSIPTRQGQQGFSVIGMHAYGYAASAVAKLVTPAT